MKTCHSCGEPWEGSPGSQPGKNETCSKCDADLHVCFNCHNHDPAAYNECRSRTAEPVKEKTRHNLCDEFRFDSQGSAGTSPSVGAPKNEMEQKWKDLFG